MDRQVAELVLTQVVKGPYQRSDLLERPRIIVQAGADYFRSK